MCRGSPKPPLGSVISRRTPRTHRTVTLMAVCYFRKCYEAWLTEKECAEGRVQGKAAADIRCPLPAESHQTHFILPATSCDHTGDVLPDEEAHERLSVQGFDLGWSRGQPEPGMHQDSRRKADVPRKLCRLYKQFRNSEPFLSVRERWEAPQIHVPRHQPRASLSSRPFWGKQSGPAILTLLCTLVFSIPQCTQWQGSRGQYSLFKTQKLRLKEVK